MAFQVSFTEDSPATILGRVTARNGSGSATGVSGEGNWIQQADVSSITYETFDLEAPTTVATSGTLTVSDAILDTPVTSTAIWTKDSTGYNFIHDLPAAAFPSGGRVVRIEYEITLAGGAVLHGIYEGTVCNLKGS